MDEDIKYQLTVTAYNYFGASQSDPVILCVNDTGRLTFLFLSVCMHFKLLSAVLFMRNE